MSDAGLDIGTLSGRIELEDRLSPVLDLSQVKVEQFEAMFSKLGHTVVENAESFFLAEAALDAIKEGAHLAAESLKEIVIEGSHAAQIEATFDRMTASAGQFGDELLGHLRVGVHDTITDLDLMTRVNQNLAVGLNLTTQQTDVLAKGAFALSKATGGDTASAFDRLSDAMVTGRVRGVQLLTGKIDLADAEDRYAAALGTTSDKLNAVDKQHAIQEEILRKVAENTARVGEETFSLADKFTAVSVGIANFKKDLGEAIATSPHIQAAFEAIEGAIQDAFGGDRKTLLDTFVEWVNTAADAVTRYGPGVIRTLVDIKDGVLDVWHSVVDAWDAVPQWFKNVAEYAALTGGALYLVSGALKGVDSGFSSLLSSAANIGQIFTSLKEGLPLTVKAVEALAAATGPLNIALTGTAATLGPIAVGIAAVAAAATIGYQAWKLYSESQERAAEDVKIAAGQQEVIARASALAGKEFKNFADAAQYLNQRLVDLRAGIDPAKRSEDELAEATRQAAHDADLAASATRRYGESQAYIADHFKMTREEMKQYTEGVKALNAVGATYEETVARMDQNTVEAIKYYLDAGVSQEKLAGAYRITVESIKAVAEAMKQEAAIYAENTKTLGILAKLHGDSISDWIELENRKYQSRLSDLERTHTATKAALEAELAEHNATVDAEIAKREELDVYSKAFYEKQVNEARAALDLRYSDMQNFTNEDIQLAEQDFREKSQKLAHWVSDSIDKRKQLSQQNKQSAREDIQAFDSISEAVFKMGSEFDRTKAKVKLLSGEIVTLAEADAKRLAGNSTTYDLSTKEGRAKVPENIAIWLRDGYSLAQASTIAFDVAWGIPINQNDPLFRTKGPRVPGFKEGGYGDFGDGTLAMLHGKEIITPVDKLGGLGSVTNHIYVNGTAADVARQVAAEIMRTVTQTRKISAV